MRRNYLSLIVTVLNDLDRQRKTPFHRLQFVIASHRIHTIRLTQVYRQYEHAIQMHIDTSMPNI